MLKIYLHIIDVAGQTCSVTHNGDILLYYLDLEGEIIFCTLPGIGDTYAPVATALTIHFIPKVNTNLNGIDSIAYANLRWNYRPIYITVFHFLLCAELSDYADELLSSSLVEWLVTINLVVN